MEGALEHTFHLGRGTGSVGTHSGSKDNRTDSQRHSYAGEYECIDQPTVWRVRVGGVSNARPTRVPIRLVCSMRRADEPEIGGRVSDLIFVDRQAIGRVTGKHCIVA